MSKETDILEKQEITSHLSFKLNEEKFAVNVTKVIEILEVPHITKIPKAPDYMTGVINLRGNVLPLVDTRIKFGLKPKEFTVDTCIIVLEVEVEGEELQVGALVDTVLEVFDIAENEIQPSPSIDTNYDLDFIKGMFKSEIGFIMLLNMDAVFSVNDLKHLNPSYNSYSEKEKTDKTKENKRKN